LGIDGGEQAAPIGQSTISLLNETTGVVDKMAAKLPRAAAPGRQIAGTILNVPPHVRLGNSWRMNDRAKISLI
jgi:hypothetical protein